MSEMSRAMSRARLCDIFRANRNTELKEAFKLGWEAREILLNKRVAEIEKAATLKERERWTKNSIIQNPVNSFTEVVPFQRRGQ